MSEIEEIRRVIADVERGFNTHDAAVMDERVVPGFVSPIAVRDDQFARYEVRDVRFLRPDVALVAVTVHAVTESGEPLDLDHSMDSLYVLAKEDGRWLIAARHNTLVPR